MRDHRTARSASGAILARVSLGLALILAPTGAEPLAAASGPFATAGARPLQEDPAAELYRRGREALNSGRYTEAAELLARVAREHPTWDRAGDALYWNAYALYRTESYERALGALERVLEEFPVAAERGDAAVLRMRIEGALARSGDAEAAASVARQAMLATAPIQQARSQAQVSGIQTQATLMQAEAAMHQARLQEAAAGLEGARVPGVAGVPGRVTGRFGRGFQEGCEEAEVQTAALNALLMMDAERALPVLEKVIARRDECSEPLRAQATWLIGQKAGERAEGLLLQVVREDPSSEVRGQAVFWLSRVEGEGAVAALEEILASEADPELHNNALFALSRHPSERALEVLRAYALDESKPEAGRAQAVFWLSRHDAFDDIEALAQLYGRLSSADLKAQVLHAAAQNADDPAAIDWLVGRVLDESESTEVRKQALFWAGQAGVGIDRLDGLYESLTDREMKVQLVFVYSRSEDEAAVDRLLEIARTEGDPEIRKQAIFWLGRSDDPRAADFLIQLLESP